MNYLFDIDGTLRNFGTEPDIAPNLLDTLSNLKGNHSLTVVTGRTYNNFNAFKSEIIAANNGQVDVHNLFENIFCEDGHILYNSSNQSQVLINKTAEQQIERLRKHIGSLNLSYPSQELRGEVVIVIQERENVKSAKPVLDAFIENNNLTQLTIKQLTHNRLSVSVKGTSKLTAIELSPIDMSNAVFFCDENNDLELCKAILDKGGEVVCPSNAIEEIKALANYVSSKPYSYGVVDYLTKSRKS